jgi:hypothetical protein
VGGLFGGTPAPSKSETKESTGGNSSNGTKGERHTSRGMKTPVDSGKEGTNSHAQVPPPKQFEVKDAQNGRQLFVTPVPPQKSAIATPQVSGGQTASGSLMQETEERRLGPFHGTPRRTYLKLRCGPSTQGGVKKQYTGALGAKR